MIVYIGLGSNLRDLSENLRKAREEINLLKNCRILRESSEICTKPYGREKQPDFLNQIIEVETELQPLQMLAALMKIEEKIGRIRKEKWGPRIIDLDILFWGNLIYIEDDLVIPHPDLHRRLFVLRSMLELNPDFLHPVLLKTIKELYSECRK